VKAHHLTATSNPVAEAHPIYKEAYNFARELNKLTEGKQLNTGEIHTLFTNAEQAMTAGGGNRTMLGKAGEMASALGQKIKGLAQALQDTTPIKGVDSMFDDLKQKASASMGKSPQGSAVLRALDGYKQIVQKHPNTSKFFWGVAGVLTGVLTGGAGPVIALGAIKTIDGLLQDKQLSTSVGGGLGAAGTAMGAKALATGADAAAQGVSSAADAVQQGARSATDAVQNFDPNTLNPFNKTPVTPGGETVPGGTEVVPPKVDPNAPTAPVAPGAETQTITVKQGDTMSGIADKYKVNPDELAKLNPGKFGPNGNPNVINPGDQIVLPKNIDAAAYKGAYQGDNAMTAQNINAKTQAGQYGSDGGMAAKRVAADAATAKAGAAGKVTAQAPAPSASSPAPSASTAAPAPKLPADPNLRWDQQAESFKFKAGRGILEGIQLITLPTTITVDKAYTVQKWALNESLGRPRNSVQLTEAGIMTLFMNLQRIDEAVTDRPESQTPEAEAKRQARAQARAGTPIATDGRAPGSVNTTNLDRTQNDLERDQQGGTVRNRPANANDPTAMAKNARTSATNTSTTAGPLGGLPGGNVGGLATGQAPAGNTMPYLAADPEGKFDTNYKGGTSTGASRGIETGLGRAGNWIKDKWKDATTKVTANGLKRHWADAGSPTDSDQVAAVLQRLKVPDDVITQLYQQLNFPAPALPQAATDADGNARSFVDGTADMSGGAQGAAADAGADAGGATGGVGGDSVDDRLMGTGGQQGGGQGGGQGQSAGDGRISQATTTILPQLARMTGPANADDLITIIDTAMSVLQRSAPTAYREKMAQFRGQSAGQQREKAQDIITRTRGQNQGGSRAQPAQQRPPLGPSRVAPNNPGAPTDAERANFDQRVAQATGTMGESRKRTYGGKYVKESADQKLARQFENFLLRQE
jgi:LysM repeat protein